MVEADLLSGELCGRPPDVRISETFAPVAVDRIAHHPHVGTGLDDQWVREIRLLPLRFEEDAHEPKRLVDLVLEARESDPFLRGNRNELPTGQLRLERLHVFRRHEIDLVHNDEGLHVHPVPRQHVDQLVLGNILADDDRAVQISPLSADVGDELLVQLRQLDRTFTRRPPRFAFVRVTSAGRSFSRIPADRSSSSRTSTWVSNTSIIRRIRSQPRATERTSFPRPRPFDAPRISPGMSRT